MLNRLKSVLSIMLVLVLALSLMNLDDAQAQKKKKKKKKGSDDPPEWTYKPGLYEDVIIGAGVGSAFSEKAAKSKAELDARKKIAEALKVQIKSMSTSFIEEASSMVAVETDEGSLFSSEEAANEYFQEVTQSVTQQTLEGAIIEEYWPPLGMQDGKKVKYYAKCVLGKNSVVDAFKEKVKKDVEAKESKLPAKLKDKSFDALDALDKAIEKWESAENQGSATEDEDE